MNQKDHTISFDKKKFQALIIKIKQKRKKNQRSATKRLSNLIQTMTPFSWNYDNFHSEMKINIE